MVKSQHQLPNQACASPITPEQYPQPFVVLEQEGTSSAVEEISMNGSSAHWVMPLINYIKQTFGRLIVVPSSLPTIVIIIVLLPVMFSGAIIQQQMSVRDMSS